MAYLDPTAFANAMKRWYPDGFERPEGPESAFFAWLTKRDDWDGDNWQINPRVDFGNGSATFSDALAGQSNPTYPKFLVPLRQNFHVFGINSQLLLTAKGKRGAIEEALKSRTDDALEEFDLATAVQIWGNGGGARGQIDSTTVLSSQTVVLADSLDSVKFRKGMKVQAASDDGSAASPAGVRSGEVTIDAVSDTGFTIVEATIAGAISGVAASDYLFRKGDYALVPHGVLGWIPATAPTAGDSWMGGQDRSDDVVRLSGYRHNGGGRLFEEEIVTAIARGGRYGGKYDTAFANPVRVAEVIQSMQARSRIAYEVKTIKATDAKQNVLASYTGVVFATPRGAITLIGDDFCPYTYSLITRSKAWEFRSASKWPHFEKGPTGQILHLAPSADGQQARLKGYGNLGCKRPVDCILYAPDAS